MSGRRAVRSYDHQVVCLEAASPLHRPSGRRRLTYIPAPRCKSGLKLNKSLPWCLVTPENASNYHSHFFRFRPADNAGATPTTTRSSSSQYQPVAAPLSLIWKGKRKRSARSCARIGGGPPAEGFHDAGRNSATPPARHGAIRVRRACSYS